MLPPPFSFLASLLKKKKNFSHRLVRELGCSCVLVMAPEHPRLKQGLEEEVVERMLQQNLVLIGLDFIKQLLKHACTF